MKLHLESLIQVILEAPAQDTLGRTDTERDTGPREQCLDTIEKQVLPVSVGRSDSYPAQVEFGVEEVGGRVCQLAGLDAEITARDSPPVAVPHQSTQFQEIVTQAPAALSSIVFQAAAEQPQFGEEVLEADGKPGEVRAGAVYPGIVTLYRDFGLSARLGEHSRRARQAAKRRHRQEKER